MIASASADSFTPSPPVSRSSASASASELSTALDKLSHVLADPTEALAAVRAASFDVALALEHLDRTPPRGPLTDALMDAANALSAHPAGAFPVSDSALATARQFTRTGWVGSLARLFEVPAWQVSEARPLADQPAWLWSAYARHLFAAAPFFQTAEQEHAWADHLVAHLEPLVRMLESNRGSASVNAVVQHVLEVAAHWPSVGTDSALRRRQGALGRLLTLRAPRLAPYHSTATADRAGHPGAFLRVGLIRETSAPGLGIFDADRLKALLDPERFEVTAYALNDLPGDIANQVATLRAAQFDAVIFAGDLTRPASPLTALALHRVAPRQFATALCPHTSGLPEIDVFLGDNHHAQAAHTERLASLPAALAFAVPGEAPTVTRADFELPADARLIATTVHPAHFTAATRTRWQALLGEDARARILLLPDASGPALDHLLADLERVFGDRLIIAGTTPLEPHVAAALLNVSDAYVSSGAPGSAFHRHLARHLGVATPEAPAPVDCLAFADAFAGLIETACGAPDQPLVAPAPASDVASRQQQARDLTAIGRPDRAAIYLLAAVETPDAGPDIWHDLALALHASGQAADAVQALETCVQLAPDRLDAWLLLADWAIDYGHDELLRDIVEVVKSLAPADQRVVALSARIAA